MMNLIHAAVLFIGCNVIHRSNAGSAFDMDVFKSLTKDDAKAGYHLVDTKSFLKSKKAIRAKTSSVDLCFLVDTTGSMCPYIRAVQDSIRDTVNDLKTHVKQLRVSFVGYRDFGDKGKKIKIIPFTSNFDQFLKQVEAVPATGGGDFHEDVYSGLQESAKLPWSGRRRIILHMADAPCHGPGCRGTSKQDTKDPLGRDIEDIFRDLRIQKIFYTFGRIRPVTNDMINTFAEAWGRTIEMFDLSVKGSPSCRRTKPPTKTIKSGGPKSKLGLKKSLRRKIGPAPKARKLGGVKSGGPRSELKKKVGDASVAAVLLGIID